MKIKRVIFWTNGNVSVFDYNGEQVGEYQGHIFEKDKMELIKKNADENTQFSYAQWHGIELECNFKWMFEKEE